VTVEINRSNNNNQHQHQHQVSRKPGQVQASIICYATDENQRFHRDRHAAESARRCRSQRESGTGPRATVELSVGGRTSSSQASAVLLDQRSSGLADRLALP
jgi:hypothetical protein